MYFILFYMTVLIVSSMGEKTLNCQLPSAKFIVDRFQKYGIVPQIIPRSPTKPLSVKLERQKDLVQYGNILLGFNYPNQPTAYFEADPSSLYTLVYFSTDMYYVERGAPRYSYLFTLIVNIPGGDVQSGNPLCGFQPFVPPTGHPGCRIVGLTYEQNNRINITTDLLLSVMTNVRQFDLEEFANTNELGDPIAGTFNIVTSPYCAPLLDDVC